MNKLMLASLLTLSVLAVVDAAVIGGGAGGGGRGVANESGLAAKKAARLALKEQRQERKAARLAVKADKAAKLAAQNAIKAEEYINKKEFVDINNAERLSTIDKTQFAFNDVHSIDAATNTGIAVGSQFGAGAQLFGQEGLNFAGFDNQAIDAAEQAEGQEAVLLDAANEDAFQGFGAFGAQDAGFFDGFGF